MNPPLTRPVIYVREALPPDAPFLIEAAGTSNFKTLNFPETVSALSVKIRKSQQSFRGAIADPGQQEFLFTVLSETGERAVPVGTSTFFPKHRTPEKPHHAYRVHESYLEFVEETDGPAEVGGMIVHKEYQGGGYGRVGSWVRFFWTTMPENRELFRGGRCLTEFLPDLEDRDETGSRTNPFYEAVGKIYLQAPYDKMDKATAEDHTLLKRLPRRIDLSDLPEEARKVIGQVGKGPQKAAPLLVKLGFKPNGQIDPLDGGPHYVGLFDENPIFTGARNLYFEGVEEGTGERDDWLYGFLGLHHSKGTPRFEACAAPFRIEEGRVKTTLEAAEKLKLDEKKKVTVSPFP
jgi:arginine N-succinyltransferase